MQPLVVPAFREINISPQGEIFIQPIGGEPDALPQNIGVIATYKPGDNDNLKKTLDGHIRIESEPNENGNECMQLNQTNKQDSCWISRKKQC